MHLQGLPQYKQTKEKGKLSHVIMKTELTPAVQKHLIIYSKFTDSSA